MIQKLFFFYISFIAGCYDHSLKIRMFHTQERFPSHISCFKEILQKDSSEQSSILRTFSFSNSSSVSTIEYICSNPINGLCQNACCFMLPFVWHGKNNLFFLYCRCVCVCVCGALFFVACLLKCFNYDQMRESRTESQEPENMCANGMDGASGVREHFVCRSRSTKCIHHCSAQKC